MSNPQAARPERRNRRDAWLMTCPCWRRRSGTASDAKARARADPFGASMAGALQKPGCPGCVNLAEGGRQHVFSFLNGNYGERPIIGELNKSLGFCPKRDAVLMECPANVRRWRNVGPTARAPWRSRRQPNPSFDLHFSQRSGTFHVITPKFPDCRS